MIRNYLKKTIAMDKVKVLVVVLVGLLPVVGYGQDVYVWTGAGDNDNDWTNSANWLKNGAVINNQDYPGRNQNNGDTAKIDPLVYAFTDNPSIDGSNIKIGGLQIGGASTTINVNNSGMKTGRIEVVDSMAISGGKLLMNGTSLIVQNILYQTDGTITVTGGLFDVTNFEQLSGNGFLEIDGGAHTVDNVKEIGGKFNLNNGSFTVSNGVVMKSVSNGIFNLNNGSFQSSSFTMGGGELNINGGSVNVTGTFTTSGGNINLNGGGFTVGTEYKQSGGTLDLGNSTQPTFVKVDFTGGTVENGIVEAAEFFRLTNTTVRDATLRKTVESSSNDTSFGNNSFQGTCVIENASSGNSWTFQNGSSDGFSGPTSFINSGTGSLILGNTEDLNVFNDFTLTGSLTFGTGALIFTGTNTQSFMANSPISIGKLTLNKNPGGSLNASANSRVNFTGDLTITNSFTTDFGILAVPNTSRILLASGASVGASTVGNTDSYIDGKLQYQVVPNGTANLDFPIGKGEFLKPVSLTLAFQSSPSSSITITAEVFNASPIDQFGYTIPMGSKLENVSDIRYWEVNCLDCTGTAFSGFITLEYRDPDQEGIEDRDNLVVVKSLNGEWINLGRLGASVPGEVIAQDPFSSFSIFTLGSVSGNALPVELTAFQAAAKNDDVGLFWETATETNNDYFLVEHSLDGSKFTPLTKVKGAGDSQSAVRYEAVHADAPAGLNYYRLKQVDFDGTYDYSDIVSVRVEGDDQSVGLFPNPAREEVQVRTGRSERLRYMILDTFGRRLRSGMVEPRGSIDISQLPEGTYHIRLESDGGTLLKVERVVKF